MIMAINHVTKKDCSDASVLKASEILNFQVLRLSFKGVLKEHLIEGTPPDSCLNNSFTELLKSFRFLILSLAADQLELPIVNNTY